MKPYSIIRVPAFLDKGARVPRSSMIGGVIIEEFSDRTVCKMRAAELRAAHPAFHFYPQFNYADIRDTKTPTRAVDVKEARPEKKQKRVRDNVVKLVKEAQGG